MQFNIITPDRVFLEEKTDEIILPTNTGQMGVLTGHAPLITALDIGVLFYRSKQTWISLALMGGFALILLDNITILVNEIEDVNTIDLEEAQQTFKTTKKTFLGTHETSKERMTANLAFKRARARYQVICK